MGDLMDKIPTNEKGEKERRKGVNAYMPPSKPKKPRKMIRAATAILLAAACFILGGFTVWFSLDAEIRTLLKVKLAIDRHYYQDIDDD